MSPGQRGHAYTVDAPLFERQPGFCPFGHLLGPGRVLISWTPCICQPAKEAAKQGRGMGHATLRCRACEDQGRTTIYSEPPHDVTKPHAR